MNQLRFLFLSALLLPLAGCGSVGDALGLGRTPPDEFTVVDRPPLTLPPDFTLRPPQPGAPRPQDAPAAAQAQAALKEPAGVTRAETAPSASETALLQQAGGATSAEDIRALVDKEAGEVKDDTPEFVRSLLFFREEKNPAAAPLDPEAEAARLKQAQEQGLPLTTGKTPLLPERGQPEAVGADAVGDGTAPVNTAK